MLTAYWGKTCKGQIWGKRVKWECFRTLNELFKTFQIVRARLGSLAAGKALLEGRYKV
jgi:hypothetical protein